MSYTAKVVENVVRTGLTATYTAFPSATPGSGFSVANDGKTVLHFKNVAAGGNAVVTVNVPRTTDGQAVTERTVTIADGAEAFIGPFPTGIYNQEGSVGSVLYVDCDEITNVTMAALSLG